MQVVPRGELCEQKCGPCSRQNKDDLLSPEMAKAQLAELKEGWYLTHDGQRIRKDWKVRNFKVGMNFLQQVGDIAEEEGHHPGMLEEASSMHGLHYSHTSFSLYSDLHLEGYQYVAIEIFTHSIGGLSVNDFILAAKIDEVPVELSKKQPPKRKAENEGTSESS